MSERTPATDPGNRDILLAAAPLAAAILVFGVIFGAAASAEFGPELTVLMSLLVYSGTVQFAALGLVAAGAGSLAVVLLAVALNARNLVLGAALRPRLRGSRRRRALLGWFLIDESFGLAMAARQRPGRVLLLTGAACYVAWQVGTLLGVAGTRVVALEGVAGAIFPVLFIGLAAITADGRGGATRAAAAALLVAALTLLVPGLHAFLPVLAAVVVAIVGSRGRS